ncbi:Major facilitator superfamily, general substrate transporter [Penicillium camemberti]|uniref:Major facilitator superfamily, general substrate transporter n=1 Tax=Penicillium camemberti (strain FM 013) TaxID=1429867 RepID=A0A0G4NZC6_PENC3|nr:Major facilitator superfamily, general substrate transporter [Penicillium camemberti]
MSCLPTKSSGSEPSANIEITDQSIVRSSTINNDNLSQEDQKDLDDNEILRKVAGPIPGSVWLVMLLSMAERFSFYGMTAPFMNFMQNGRNDPLHPGALGWGQSRASEVSNVFFILSLLTPIGASLAADKSLGRYNVLCITFAFYFMGAILLLVSSLPSLARVAAPLFIVSLFLIAVGMSGVNGLMAAFVSDQLPGENSTIVATKRGERVIIDRARTLETIYNIYYWSINVGGLAGLATTELELHVGFWAAYLLPTSALVFSASILYFGKSRFTVVAAESTALPNAAKVIWLGLRDGFSLDKAKGSYQQRKHGRQVSWTDGFVEEVKKALAACRMMYAAWPILWICRGQVSNNLVSQAAQMQSSGVPNDMMYNTNPIVIIIFIPIVDRVLFPWLRRSGFALTALTRLVCGFILEALAMAMAAIVQHLIYSSGPCYEYPLSCIASDGGSIPNSVNIFLQVPIFALEAFSETLSSPAGYELAYTMAPSSMKSVLQALFSTTGAVGSSLSLALSPLYGDPYMVWVYSSLAIAMGTVTLIFYFVWNR